MSKPVVRSEGDAYRLIWEEARIGAYIARLREQGHGELYAEITWYGLKPAPQGGWLKEGHIHGPARANVVSTQTQRTLANLLASRCPTVDWGAIVEQAYHTTVEEYRRGVPPVDLADVPSPGPRRYLVTRLLPEQETSMIYADGGGGKSLTGLFLAYALRTGTALPGNVVPQRQCEVAYFDWETSKHTHRRRLEAIAAGFGQAVPRGIAYFRMARSISQEAEWMREACGRMGVGLAIIDSAGYAIGGDMKEGGPVTELFAALRAVEITVLVIHHLTKAAAAQETGRADPFGSAYFRNSARNAWELRSLAADDGRLKLALFHRKDNDGQLQRQPIGWEYRWDAQGACTIHACEVADEPELAAHQGVGYVLKGLLAHDLLTISQLAEETGYARDTVKKALQRSAQFRQVEHTGPGRGHEARWGLAQPLPGPAEVPW